MEEEKRMVLNPPEPPPPPSSAQPSTSSSSSYSNGGGGNWSETNNNSNNSNTTTTTSEDDVDDFCVYTYKGDSRADLPSSFFEFYPRVQINNNNNNNINRTQELYSPDMDFLEMDFDPGGNASSINAINEDLVPSAINSPSTSTSSNLPPIINIDDPIVVNQETLSEEGSEEDESHEKPNCSSTSKNVTNTCSSSSSSTCSTSSVIRLVKSNTLPQIGNKTLLSRSAMVVSNSAPLLLDNTNLSSKSIELEVNGAMIWTLEEAFQKSLSQIGTSACGATAILNVLQALGLKEEMSEVKESVKTRLRDETADLPEYLLSRSNAGATHKDLIQGMHLLTKGAVYARFFQPNHNISSNTLIKWLLHWICQGAVPVATLNLQRVGSSEEIPDAWHHQMIFGVTQEGVFLNNPVEIVSHSVILPQLTSPSVLLIRRQDVIMRKGPRTDLKKLARFNQTWNQLNVLGQVSNMLLEEMPVYNGSSVAKRVRSTHITIPASYKSGITLFVLTNSPLCQLLQNTQEI